MTARRLDTASTTTGTIGERLAETRTRLTNAERRVAAVVEATPQAVAFGTVAEIARRADASGPTVMRLAAKLGFGGFADLQSAVQDELAAALRPAAERIRGRPAVDPVSETLTIELENVHATLEAVDADEFATAATLLADVRRHVFVLAGDAERCVGAVLAGELGVLRDGVELLEGPEVRVAQRLAFVRPGDVVLAADLRRYERWLVSAARAAAEAGAAVIACTDSRLSPIADGATTTFVVSAKGAGPFDSQVGMLALANALVAAVAGVLRASATKRLDAVEAAWRSAGALVD